MPERDRLPTVMKNMLHLLEGIMCCCDAVAVFAAAPLLLRCHNLAQSVLRARSASVASRLPITAGRAQRVEVQLKRHKEIARLADTSPEEHAREVSAAISLNTLCCLS